QTCALPILQRLSRQGRTFTLRRAEARGPAPRACRVGAAAGGTIRAAPAGVEPGLRGADGCRCPPEPAGQRGAPPAARRAPPPAPPRAPAGLPLAGAASLAPALCLHPPPGGAPPHRSHALTSKANPDGPTPGLRPPRGTTHPGRGTEVSEGPGERPWQEP